MEKSKHGLSIIAAVFTLVMALGIGGFMITEGLSFSDALYFSVVTVTTVGYGDITPKTEAGRILSMLIIILGVGTFSAVVANATGLVFSRKVQQFRREKLNMMLGIFFSEVGTQLLTQIVRSDSRISDIREMLRIDGTWSHREFQRARDTVKVHNATLTVAPDELERLRDFLSGKTDFFLRVFENPYLTEHETFTELLRAVIHVKEELAARTDLAGLPDPDYHHLARDIKRVYRLLVDEWLQYMEYLMISYPYLFSLAIRMNPFDETASVVVKG
jgi:voltage-gated potassium channel